ncbi:MAG TPA: hypothetical protein VFH40_03110 [Gemmatimonadales bacterium]|nr:hypothetical protein [Gemmatimonadales bacterium]
MPADSAPTSATLNPASLGLEHSETLVRLDCRGELRPGLASQWSGDASGHVWHFSLRPQPYDSSAIASSVVSTWQSRGEVLRALGIEAVVAVDPHTLRVTLAETSDSAPRLFADPALALARDTAIGADPRDALDRGADLVVTADPAVRDYVSHRAEFMSFALPWSRTYVLVQPSGSASMGGVLGRDSVVRSLASDVVPAEARPAAGPFWWQEQKVCLSPAPASDSGSRIPRMAYPSSDRVAAAVAERIVALADKPTLRAAGLSDTGFVEAYQSGRYAGYVMALPRQVAAPCYRSRRLLLPGASVVPLIDTRATVIMRRGSPPVTLDWDGTVRPMEPEDSTRSAQ